MQLVGVAVTLLGAASAVLLHSGDITNNISIMSASQSSQPPTQTQQQNPMSLRSVVGVGTMTQSSTQSNRTMELKKKIIKKN